MSRELTAGIKHHLNKRHLNKGNQISMLLQYFYVLSFYGDLTNFM